MSQFKNFAVSASRGSMAVFVVGVVVALVGAMMLFAPAGFAQEDPEADEALVAYDDASDVDALTEEIASAETPIDEAPASASDSAPAPVSDSAPASASEASEAVEKPEGSKDPVSVVRDGDIDTVTIDDRDTKAWRDSETGMEKVSDDALYGISRESDAGIDEIVEVEADGIVVDEDAYGFIYDDEDKLDKIVIDYYGLKTTPPETLTLKVKSSKEGEYSILDADDVPAKAEVQDAGFLPDSSAEKQEKIDKANKENRAATGNQTKKLVTDENLAKGDAVHSGTGFQTQVRGQQDDVDIFLNRIIIHDPEGQLDRGLNSPVYIQKGSSEKCTIPATKVNKVEQNPEFIELDLSDCNPQPAVWEGSGNRVMTYFQNVGSVDLSKLGMTIYGSTVRGQEAGDIDVPLPEGAPQTDDAFILETEGDIEASANVESRDNPFKDSIKIAERSEFKGATVTVKASNNILAPWKASNYRFYIADTSGKTGLQEGYKFGIDLIQPKDPAEVTNEVSYEIFPVDKNGSRTEKAVIEKDTEIFVESSFNSLFGENADSITTKVVLDGSKVQKAKKKNWTGGETQAELFPSASLNKLFSINSIIWGVKGPFAIHERGGEDPIVMWGGMCLRPELSGPQELVLSEFVKDNWQQIPNDTNPLTGERTISENKQRALSFLVNETAYLGPDRKQAEIEIPKKVQRVVAEAGLGNNLTNVQAYDSIYSAVLKLTGYSNEDIAGEANWRNDPKLRSAFERADRLIDYLLNEKNLQNEPINYQIIKYNGLTGSGEEVQPIIVPGAKGDSAIATTASLEDDEFGDYRAQTVDINNVDTAYDRLDYRGLKEGSYTVKTEIHYVEDEATGDTKRVYPQEDNTQQDVGFDVDSSGEGHVDVAINLKEVAKKNLKPGRYVFFESVLDSSGKPVAKHENINDKAQSFWIEEAPEENPSDASLELKKVSSDDENKAIHGAEFTVSDTDNPNSPNAKVMKELKGVSSDAPNYRIDGLKTGKAYWLFETKAPEGKEGQNYQLLSEPIKFRLTKDGTPQLWDKDNGTYLESDKTVFPVVESGKAEGDGVVGVMTIANVWIGDLPKTGGNGIAPWLLLGGLIMAAGALMGNRRRA